MFFYDFWHLIKFSGKRGSCRVLCKLELFLIRTVEYGIKVNLVLFLCHHLMQFKISTAKSLFVGPLVNFLTKELCGLNPYILHCLVATSLGGARFYCS